MTDVGKIVLVVGVLEIVSVLVWRRWLVGLKKRAPAWPEARLSPA